MNLLIAMLRFQEIGYHRIFQLHLLNNVSSHTSTTVQFHFRIWTIDFKFTSSVSAIHVKIKLYLSVIMANTTVFSTIGPKCTALMAKGTWTVIGFSSSFICSVVVCLWNDLISFPSLKIQIFKVPSPDEDKMRSSLLGMKFTLKLKKKNNSTKTCMFN